MGHIDALHYCFDNFPTTLIYGVRLETWENMQQATGEHFILPGKTKNKMTFTIIDKVRSHDPLYGREREKVHIRKFNTFYGGINREPRYVALPVLLTDVNILK